MTCDSGTQRQQRFPDKQIPADSASVNILMAHILMYHKELEHSWLTLLKSHFKMHRLTFQKNKFYILDCRLHRSSWTRE